VYIQGGPASVDIQSGPASVDIQGGPARVYFFLGTSLSDYFFINNWCSSVQI
jgi:hypothetical protein